MWAGVSAGGSIPANSMAMRQAFFILFLAEPGWMLKPRMVTRAEAALKFSYSRVPRGPPSTV